MLIELHIIQSFAPANLNRDDTGAPKDCTFGGVRRGRISSQCIKKAIRDHFREAELLDEDELGKRTRLLRDELARRFAKKAKPEEVEAVAAAAVEGMGLKVVGDGETQYLIFIGPNEITELAALCEKYWDKLVSVAPGTTVEDEARPARGRKKKVGKGLPEDFKKLAEKVLAVPKAADIGLFGRMLADLPEKNIDAACQVAHALSTHRAEMEMDFYTAVDDLQTIESDRGAGAGMMGTVSFNAATFYRYANIHFPQLVENLQGDRELARKSVAAFLRASLEAVPSGKQNSFAAYNPPSFAMALARDKGQVVSLANAFERPVRADREGGFVVPSIVALDAYWGRVARAFGVDNGSLYFLNIEEVEPEHLPAAGKVGTADELVEKTLEALA